MTHSLQPITITPAQIVAAAQLIINAQDDGWEYTESQVLAAVENWLRCKVSDILADADWFFAKDQLTIDAAIKGTTSFVEEATELVMPEPPEWATQEIFPAVQ